MNIVKSSNMDVLSTDFQVCVKIYEYNQRDEKIWYSKLTKDMTLSPATISKAIDRLTDSTIIDRQWEQVDGRWTYTLHIADDSISFVKSLYIANEQWSDTRCRTKEELDRTLKGLKQ